MNETAFETIASAASVLKLDFSSEGFAGFAEDYGLSEAAIEAVTGKTYGEMVHGEGFTEKGTLNPNSLTKNLDDWGKEIESMFGDFPLLQDVCQGLKRSQYPAAVFVAVGVLMTLMTRCWYRFYHRPQQERRLNCSLYIIGHPASGKSMADDICDVLIIPILNADKASKAALNKYKRDSKKRVVPRVWVARTMRMLMRSEGKAGQMPSSTFGMASPRSYCVASSCPPGRWRTSPSIVQRTPNFANCRSRMAKSRARTPVTSSSPPVTRAAVM